jgi:hypothetical protein
MERPSWGGEIGAEAALLPGTNRLDPRVESLLRTMGIPVVRFPGGSDVDFLDWRDMVTDAHGKGVGRPDSTTHKEMIVTNAFGYDEYLRLAAEMKWQSILVVNLREGLAVKPPSEAAAHAAALLAYCVGNENAVPKEFRNWPVLRAANGHPEPYRVEYVQIGNETWFFAEEMKKKHDAPRRHLRHGHPIHAAWTKLGHHRHPRRSQDRQSAEDLADGRSRNALQPASRRLRAPRQLRRGARGMAAGDPVPRNLLDLRQL